MKKSSFIEGTFIATLAIIIVKILGMLYVIPFYAIVGSLGGALYAYAYNIYNIFLDISTVGLPIAISKITNEYNTLGMMDAKKRAFNISMRIMKYASIIIFIILFIFAKPIASLIIGDLSGGNSSSDITNVIRFVSISLLVIPYLSVSKGYLQGHNVINVSSVANVLEQVIRISVILLGSYFVINVLNHSYVEGVEVALTGAFFGGAVAYLYVRWKMNQNRKELGLDTNTHDDISDKQILKKILMYAIPFIVINTVSSLYNFSDMLIVMRSMEQIGFSAGEIEFIATAISTWSGKINMIITSIAMGMTISLIPSIVSSYTLKKWKDVNKKINSSYSIILFISIPMAIGLSFLSQPVWSIFYGASEIGSKILSLSVFVAVCINLYMINSSILQSLNRFGLVYKAAIIGFLSNAILDYPLIMLFAKLNMPAYLGALVASIIGYLLSVLVGIIGIKHRIKEINYKEAIGNLVKTLIPSLVMLVSLFLLSYVLKYDVNSKISCLIYVAINSVVGAVIYFIVSYKMGLIDDILGKEKFKLIRKKLTK